MRKGTKNRTFGRKSNQKLALLRSLARSLVLHGSIKTTEAKAKELRPFVEKLVTKAGEGTLSSRRLVISRLNDEDSAAKLVDEIAPTYKERPGGYTRITKLPIRLRDAAKMAQIEFVK